ncbi:MAG TPA: hypothetical protein PLM89_02830 [Anaerolineales bacterium]|nr:hypothetical protein [Anaerolineales bacterium]
MTKEYPLTASTRRKILFWAFLIIGLREIFNTLIPALEIPEYAYYALRQISFFILVIALYSIIHAYTEKLFLSPSGITLQHIGLQISVKWNDIDRIGSVSNFPWKSCEALFTQKEKASLINGKGKQVHHPPLFNDVSIKLSRYSENWRDSELGQQIKHYAPHLFEKEKSA